MSQRNWKTTQRKTNRNVLQNFASRPINTLSSIKEASSNSGVSTTSNSMQSQSSTSDASSGEKESSSNEGHVAEQHQGVASSSPNNDIYQIIEEECHKGDEEKNDDVDTKSSPTQVFQHVGGLENDDDLQEFIDLDKNEIENPDVEVIGEGHGGYDEMDEEDDDNPIIYAHHDDDSISQITSSVAGYSMYSSDNVLSRQLSSGDHNSAPSMNHGGVSHMRPNMSYGHSFVSQNNSSLKKRNSEGTSEEKSPLMEDEELNKFFGPSSEGEMNQNDDPNNDSNRNIEGKDDDLIDVDIYTNQNRGKMYSSGSEYQSQGGDDLTLTDMYSIDPSVSNDSRRTFTTEAQNEMSFASVLKKARLKAQSVFFKAKLAINNYADSSTIGQKKNDDIDQQSTQYSQYSEQYSQYSTSTSGETDYFGMLMSSNFVSTSSNASLYRFRNRKENQINFIWISCLLILIWLLLYLAKIGNDTAFEQRQMQKLANKLHGLRGDKSPAGELDHGNINVAEVEVFHPDKVLPTYSTDSKSEPASKEAIVEEQTPLVPQQNAPIITKDLPVVTDAGPHYDYPLPDYFNSFVDVHENSVPAVPFFWHIPRTAGATINEILSVCYHLRIASNPIQGHEQDTAVELIDVGAGHHYVNVDVSTIKGIQNAVSRGLISSGLSDVVVSSLINEVGSLFYPDHKARVFTMIRHPVMRAASLFYFLQDVQWRAKATYNEALANIDIHDFFRARMGESNWQVRYLTNQVTKPYIDESDLNLAKEILRRKIFVGLTSEREESFARFQKIFGWKLQNQEDVECLNNRLHWDWTMKHPHQAVGEGTELWGLISEHNRYDVELFEYAKVLFQEQAALFK